MVDPPRTIDSMRVSDRRRWPDSPDALLAAQHALAAAATAAPPWHPDPALAPVVAGVFVCFARGAHGAGARGDLGHAAAAAAGATARVAGPAGGPYEPGLLALREGALLETAVRALPRRPDVLLVDATGRDHPRRAGLALHLGAVLDLPTIGVTHRPLLATGDFPAGERGAHAPLRIGEEVVAFWLVTRAATRPLAVHPAWRTDAATARALVLAVAETRTPEPLRAARRAARTARAGN
jgi:deoxyribonuclease V